MQSTKPHCNPGIQLTNFSAVLQVLPLAQSAVAARLEIAPALPGNRDLLYLDLALEDVVRGAAERGASALGIGAAAFVGPLLQNLVRPGLAMHVDVQMSAVSARTWYLVYFQQYYSIKYLASGIWRNW